MFAECPGATVLLGAAWLMLGPACNSTPSEPALAPTSPAPVAPLDRTLQAVESVPSSAQDACRACRQKHCSNYQGLINLVTTCFQNEDQAFTAECSGAVECSRKNACAWGPLGAAVCFCGTAQMNTCEEPGNANGACQTEWLRAGRTTSAAELSIRFSDLSTPAGVANYMLECDRDFCPACR